MSSSIYVLCPYGLDAGLLSKAVDLAKNETVHVLIPEGDVHAAISCGAAVIHTLSAFTADEQAAALWLKEKIIQTDCVVILAPGTTQMRNVMPMLAWHLGAGLTADCTELDWDGTTLLQTRPAFGNSLLATIKSLSSVQMATVRPGTFRFIKKPNRAYEIIRETFDFSNISVICTEYVPDTDRTPLNQAQIIFAGGYGIGSAEGFQKLRKLARAVGGTVAASRNAVDAGFAPYHCQVGMTGITVCPRLYIAIGISGAVQHLAGMSGAEKVIAINSDPKAPIFDYADYGIVADWETVIDKLLEEFI